MSMTSRERMLTAMTGGVPDRVPASPDTNWQIPARLTGRPFWDVFMSGEVPIWKAYNDCVRKFGIDGFSHHGTYGMPPLPGTEHRQSEVARTDERIVVENVLSCPAGELTQRTIFPVDGPGAPVKKWITDFEAQYECLPHLFFGDVGGISFDQYHAARGDLGDDGVVGLCMNLPTLLTQWREPTEAAFYDWYDHRELVLDFTRRWEEHLVEIAHAVVASDLAPDFVFFPNSGMITMQSAEIMKEVSFPALKRLCGIFKEAGIVTSLHCCGRERELVELAAEHTDLDCIDPLEKAPMGDCDLADIKQRFGKRLALKGNLHTTDVMLRMDADGVEREARRCLETAMEGGGFVLATGDQCGRDTPDENIVRLVEVCEKYGTY